jgi:hypothetical protein
LTSLGAAEKTLHFPKVHTFSSLIITLRIQCLALTGNDMPAYLALGV